MTTTTQSSPIRSNDLVVLQPRRVGPAEHPFSPLADAAPTGPHVPARAPNVPATPVPGAETVAVTIDGQTVTVAKGTNVLEVCKLLGKDISHFCYHPGLSVAASCRQCLVEVEKNPKLQPSCQQTVAEGMVVHTDTPRVVEARRQLVEFTLVNHPIDCPICDKAGECILQRHYMDHDHALTRVDVPKVHKSKAKDIGREIVLDQERCILCSRCIRFCDEVPGTSELGMMSRGDRERLDIAPGRRLDNDYSLNVVDICPVGALTSKDFRFKSRVWDLRTTPSTCSGCATGCATELHWRQEEADAVRLVPRHDPAVNSYWMCDEGRHTYHELAADQRVLRARVDGEDVPLAQAIAAVADRVRGKSHVAVVFSATATNETNLALARLATHLDAARFLHARPDGKGDQILRAADKNPNLAGASAAAGSVEKHAGELALELAGGAYEVVIFADTCGPLPELALRGLRDIVSIALADRSDVVSDACTIVLPATSWAESFGTYTNRQGRLRALFPAWRAEGERRARADLLRDLLVALGGTADFGGNDDLVRGLAAQHGHAVLTAALADRELARPTLMRWGHSRG